VWQIVSQGRPSISKSARVIRWSSAIRES